MSDTADGLDAVWAAASRYMSIGDFANAMAAHDAEIRADAWDEAIQWVQETPVAAMPHRWKDANPYRAQIVTPDADETE